MVELGAESIILIWLYTISGNGGRAMFGHPLAGPQRVNSIVQHGSDKMEMKAMTWRVTFPIQHGELFFRLFG